LPLFAFAGRKHKFRINKQKYLKENIKMKNKLILSCMVAILGAFSATAAPKFQNVHLIKNADGTFANQAIGAKVTLIQNSQRWTADTIYIIDRLTFLEAPAHLTIEPGTIIRMEQKTTGGTSVTDPADVATLIICRGAGITANGTAESPIIFTNIDDPFVPGGEITIPNKHNNVTDNSTYAPYDTANSANNNYVKRDYTGNLRFTYDATCGGLIILGKTPVAFGNPGSTGGVLAQLTTGGSGYSVLSAPVATVTGGTGSGITSSDVVLVMNPTGVASVSVTSGGIFTSAPTATFASTNDRATCTVQSERLTDAVGPDTIAGTADDVPQYRITGITVTKSGGGYYAAAGSSGGPTLTFSPTPTTAPVTPVTLQTTSVAQVTLKKTGNYTIAPAITIAAPGSGTAATVTTSLSAGFSIPVASPITSGIGSNFIEGFQTIDGATLGNASTFSGSIYGGADDDDNSGTLRFVSIRYGGFILSPNNEINGLTCGAVGRGTSFEMIEVANNADDGIEHFAGSVDMKYVADLFGGDDGLDLDQGYRGRIQFAFQIQDNTAAGRPTANVGDCLGEWDGGEAPNTSRPFTVHTLFNFTGIGHKVSGSNGKGINYKDNSGGKVFNSIFAGARSGITLTDSGAGSATSTTDGSTSGHRFAFTRTTGGVYNLLGVGAVTAGEPDASLQYTTFMDIGSTVATELNSTVVLLGINTAAGQYGHALLNSKNNDYKTSTTADIRSIAKVSTTGQLDPRLTAGSTIRNSGIRADASGGVRTTDTFYTQTQLRGAFRDLNWLSGWSLASEWGLLSDANVAIPAIRLTRGSGILTVNFTPTSGVEYVIETSADGKKYTPFTTVTGAAPDGDGVVPPVNQALTAGSANSLLFVRVMPL
jgi:hypothetical protein